MLLFEPASAVGDYALFLIKGIFEGLTTNERDFPLWVCLFSSYESLEGGFFKMLVFAYGAKPPRRGWYKYSY
jgi:hypothetical protein